MHKNLIALVLIASTGAAAYWLGRQMPDEAVMAFLGIMCGVMASIPVSIGLLVLLTRDRSAPTLSAETHTGAPMVETSWTVTMPQPFELAAPSSIVTREDN